MIETIHGFSWTPLSVAGALWAALAFYWLISAFGRKPAQRRENPFARLVHTLFMALAFFLLYTRNPAYDWLQTRLLPHSLGVRWLGAFVTAAGIWLAIWARAHLGKQWSGDVTIREDHKLIATGPYARIRHPIYTGLLLAILGTAIILGEVRGFLALLIATVGFWYKARKEEGFLRAQFGEAFEEHKRRTGFFLPHLG